MSQTAQDLVDAFKRSGEFDKLRYKLNHQFNGSSTKEKTVERTEQLAKETIQSLIQQNKRISDREIKEAVMKDIERSPHWKALASTIAGPDFLASPVVSTELDRKLHALLPSSSSSSSSSMNAR